MQALIGRMVSAGYARTDEIRGCTPEEVAGIEARFGLRLPQVYREFLLAMGRGAGRFFRGTDVFYPTVFELRQWAEELLEECRQPFALAGDAFVFLMHRGTSSATSIPVVARMTRRCIATWSAIPPQCRTPRRSRRCCEKSWKPISPVGSSSRQTRRQSWRTPTDGRRGRRSARPDGSRRRLTVGTHRGWPPCTWGG